MKAFTSNLFVRIRVDGEWVEGETRIENTNFAGIEDLRVQFAMDVPRLMQEIPSCDSVIIITREMSADVPNALNASTQH